MSDAPERIWHELPKESGFYYARKVEYIRADLAKPRVKPLVWEGDGHWFSGDNEGWMEEANTPFGWGYCVEFGRSFDEGTWIVESTFDVRLTGFECPEAAKAAAQADYERRILEALEDHQ